MECEWIGLGRRTTLWSGKQEPNKKKKDGVIVVCLCDLNALFLS